jgi:uncharacterized protein
MRQRRSTFDEKLAFLRDPNSYPGRVSAVHCIETHFAWVFLAGRYAYKLKKPLRQAAMDYRSLAARERGCREEIRLNRRLAPRVYLSTVALTSADGALALDGRGRVEERLVKMRRLDLSRMLDAVLARRALTRSECARLAGTLARFYTRTTAVAESDVNYVARLRREIADSRRELVAVGPRIRQSLVRSVTRALGEFLERNAGQLAGRGAWIREGHGDLRPEHVYLGSPVCVIDCLEFSRALRLLDPADEVAFLALEIERLGHPALAADLVGRYRRALADPVSDPVMCFYKSHRALLRAKLAAWHLGDPQIRVARPWVRRANSYLRDAQRQAHGALRLLGPEKSLAVPQRPVIEERSERGAGQHPCERPAEQRRDGQHLSLHLR